MGDHRHLYNHQQHLWGFNKRGCCCCWVEASTGMASSTPNVHSAGLEAQQLLVVNTKFGAGPQDDPS